MTNNQAKKPEIVYIIQPIEGDNYKILHDEAVALIESAGAEYAGTIYQNVREVNPATYIGEGKSGLKGWNLRCSSTVSSPLPKL